MIIFIIGAVVAFCWLMAGWTESNLEWICFLIKGEYVDVPYWLALLLTLFTNIFGFAFNIICELMKLVF